MDAVRKTLKISIETYEKMVFNNWFRYCEQYSFKKIVSGEPQLDLQDFQKLLSNTSLYNWWLEQYEMHEKDFVKDAEPYAALRKPKSLIKLYESIVWNVKYYYSDQLMVQARKLNLNPQLN